MKELRDIVQAVEAGRSRDEQLALATIVGVSGSTYRREGAHLLIHAGGRMVGNISGGCLEGDIAVIADEVMRDGRPRLAVYDLTADDDKVWGLGLGCNGRVDVFVERVDHGSVQLLLLEPIRAALDQERPIVMVVVLRGTEEVPAGARLVWEPDASGGEFSASGNEDFTLPPGEAARLNRAIAAALRAGHSRRATIATAAGDLDLFIEVLRPPIRLAVIGAGHDAIPVVGQGVALGWRVIVADRREMYLQPERFPGAAFHKVAFAEAAARLPLDDRTAVVVMTHNYMHDKDVLRGLLTRAGPSPFYLGMLGPRARTEKILSELAGEGVTPTPEIRMRLHGPVGLDVGSEGPEEIALAVVAEILAVDRARAAGFLRDRPGAIHTPAAR